MCVCVCVCVCVHWDLEEVFKHFQKLVNISLKVLSIASLYFFLSFWQLFNSTSEKKHTSFKANYESSHIFFHLLLSPAMCHRSEQVIIGRGNVWWIRRRETGEDINSKRFQVGFHPFCNSLVMLQNHLVQSWLVQRSFLFFNAQLKRINCSR